MAVDTVAVVVAVTRGDNERNLRDAIDAIAAADPTVPVIVGGPGTTPDRALSLGAAAAGGRLCDFVDTIGRL